MRFLFAAVVFCVAWPAAQEFPPFHKIPAAPVFQPRLLSHAEIGDLIQSAAEKHKLPSAFIKSIMAAESAFQSDAVSSKGAARNALAS